MAGTPRIPPENPTHAHTHDGRRSGRLTLLSTLKQREPTQCGKSGLGSRTTRRSPLPPNVVESIRAELRERAKDVTEFDHSASRAASGVGIFAPRSHAEAAGVSLPRVRGPAKPRLHKAAALQLPPQPIDPNALRAAIWSEDPRQIAETIDQLRLHQIPLTIQDGIPALIYALGIDSPDAVIHALLASGCSPNVINDKGYTPLIIACIKGRDEAVRMLLEYCVPSDLNYEAPDGAMALLTATSRGHTVICDMLIRDGANVLARNKLSKSALYIAHVQKQVATERLLIRAGALEVPIPDAFASIRAFRRAAKKAIVDLGAVAPLPAVAGPFLAPDLVTSRIFCFDNRDRAMMDGVIHGLYVCPELRPLIDMLALVACGKHDAGLAAEATGKTKKLNVFCAPELGRLMPQAGTNSAFGYFSQKTSVFVRTHGRDKYCTIVGTTIHELTHLAMFHLFRNLSKPYPGGVKADALRFAQIIDVTKEHCKRGMLSVRDADAVEAYRCILSVFEKYSESQRACELIVRVPQVIALLGINNGVRWLRAHVPELWEYYTDFVNPAIRAYLASHHAERFILPADHAALALAEARLPADIAAKEHLHAQRFAEDAKAVHDAHEKGEALRRIEEELRARGVDSDPRYAAAKQAHARATQRADVVTGKRWPDALAHLNP